jgi:hypothetical protein
MAVNPKWSFRSPGEYTDSDGSNPCTIICSTSAPSGAREPWASAEKGSLSIQNGATDDQPAIWLKVDEDLADEDWVLLLAEDCTSAHTIAGNWTWGTSSAIYLRDSGQSIYSPAANVGALALGAAADSWRFGDMGNANYLELDYLGELDLAGTAHINTRRRFELMDDFIQQTLTEADTPWILNSGSDDLAIDPAINAQECGVVRLTGGDGDGTVAVDGSQIVCHIPVQADSTGLIFETRLNIDSAITGVAVNAGFTDATGLEEPFSIGAADAITSTASDAACFVYDSDADTKQWFACAVDGDTDDTGNATTSTAPVADTYQVLRIEVSSDGATIRFLINGTLVKTLSGAAGVSPDVNLYATVIACSDGAAAKSVDVDYIYVSHVR